MFVSTDISKGPLTLSLRNGKVEITMPVFKDFNDYLTRIGFDTILSSFFDKLCLINIYVKATDTNIPKKFFNTGGEYNGILRQDIIDNWIYLLQKYGYDITKFDKDNFKVFVYDFETMYAQELIYKYGKEIIDKLKKAKLFVQPEYIFQSSVPSFNLVYKDLKDYNQSIDNCDIERIEEIIDNAFIYGDTLKCYKRGLVKINLYHKGMADLNLYGLSRED